jgi:catechol 2,3-dioxygenase-like lactoylglutathione lyase family enzyme
LRCSLIPTEAGRGSARSSTQFGGLRCRDLDRAQAFYEALRLSFVRHAHGEGPVHLASELGGQVFELYPLTEDAWATSATRIGFCVPDVDAAYAAVLTALRISAAAGLHGDCLF